ncbi:DNA primase [Candidatus Falkowbacteria bacterium]|nr:DNA primase [Candidatus Falkowbacteria bacterium]
MLNSQIEEIKSKIDIVDLISEYTALKPAGTNWKARCPFHNERTPSFMVSRDKQIWHCFGCGEGGDIFEFVQKIEGMEFSEALRHLAEKAGVKLKKVDPAIVSQKTKLLDILKVAAEFFHLSLLKTQEGKIGRDYIEKRNLSQKTVSDFKIGYAPDSWDKLLNFLIKKGFKQNEILLSGMVIKNEKGQCYDRFRLRLMFPIFDQHGAVVGFTGRILNEEKQDQGGKYVNTPQTTIYNKSLVIYGLDKAKNEIKKKDLAVIVEGNMDVVASHQAGITNVVASSGTALTQEQLKLLKRYTNNIALSFDADLAGQAAAERGIDAALALGFNIKIIQLPKEINGKSIKDPDDCIKQGQEFWQKAIDSAISIMDFYFDKVFLKYNKDNPEQRKEIANKLFKQIAKLPDLVERDFYLTKLAQKLDVPENILREAFHPFNDSKQKNTNEETLFNKKKIDREIMLARQLVAIILKYPQNLDYVISHLEVETLPDSQLQQIYREIILYYNDKKEFDYSQFEKILSDKTKELLNPTSTLLLLADKDFFDFTDDQIERELINIVSALKKDYINKKLKQVQMLIAQAEKQKNKQQIEELAKEFSILTSKLNNL